MTAVLKHGGALWVNVALCTDQLWGPFS